MVLHNDEINGTRNAELGMEENCRHNINDLVCDAISACAASSFGGDLHR